jgi:heme-degrading monooxygenase HmoA
VRVHTAVARLYGISASTAGDRRPSLRLGAEGSLEDEERPVYGTIARMQIRPGAQGVDEVLKRQMEHEIPGRVATYVYRSDADPNEFYLSVVFESREAYTANARSAEQDARYRELRGILAAEPEWHDGEVVHQQVRAAAR